MKVEVSIDPACKEPKVIIHTDKMTDEIENIMQCITSTEMNTAAVATFHYAFAQKTSAGISTKPILDTIMQKDN
ncbi:hypothetical protein [Lysinibacillus xylanilyticus]|uniref:Uncharacterized protein n=1 Tax=Lysinibacillus xylanilyticus TaxID=582475 RepID=A0ABT4EIB8_9BACI|nr:hypothetical protein [Lysinibacillus xylanilyticus]MCY9545400.1 hypothetical protein [Lysinibacillus xylanilyticus]